MITALFWFQWWVFWFCWFFDSCPKIHATQKGHAGFLSEGSVCTGAGQMPSYIEIEGYRLCAALHCTVAGAKGERGENNHIQLLVNPFLPLSTS